MAQQDWSAPSVALSDDQIMRSYGATITQGINAFVSDPQYVVNMVGTASNIVRKQITAEVRTQVKAAERSARKACMKAGRKQCYERVAPCGFGACSYSSEENSCVVVPSSGGTIRPAVLNKSTYRIEDTVAAIVAERMR